MKLQKKHLGVGAVALGAVLAFAVPAGAAVSLQSESNGSAAVKIAQNAQLKAKGAVTIVTLNLTCPVGNHFWASTDVSQTVSPSATTHGSGALYNQSCTGTTQKVKVTAAASPAPFIPGVAYATAHVEVYGNTNATLDTGRVIVNVDNG
ncbi:hypothetical protein [Dactylosporangium sp. NPDC051484]|uniref:hypothetical protein n=1 Tax=Dactylosporangium sp. NPDC051484 TaxID=3154942 RepID=UPI00344CFC7F